MTDDKRNFELSRRKLLGGLGGIGVASAGAALGTSAYFSDEEVFGGNSLSAGELDLMLDYRATYAGGPGRLDEVDAWYSDDGPGEPFDVVEEEEGVYLVGEVPDDGDYGGWDEAVQEWDFCDDERGLINGDEMPVFALQDLKPGDWGEVTTSFHICDNPAWVWMSGELTANDDNGLTQPESEVDDSGGAGEGELADAIETTIWYDENCNNQLEAGEDSDPICVELVLDASGSMGGSRNANTISGANALAERILTEGHDDNEVGVTFFSANGYDAGAQVQQTLTSDLGSVQNAVDALPADGGSTAIGEGIQTGQSDLENCDHDNRVMVVMTDGQHNAGAPLPGDASDDAIAAGTEIFAIGVGGATQAQLETIASDPVDDHVFIGADDSAIEQIFGQVAETIVGEQVIFEGTLAEAMDELSSGIALDGNRSTEDREPFQPAMTQCVGVEWELPPEVGNEVQSDSVAFDIGFYAEQSRHNDDPENPISS